jgi:Tol biopolymer transport system component
VALNTTGNEFQPSVLPDGSEIFFASDRSGGRTLIYHSYAQAGSFGAPQLLSELQIVGGQTISLYAPAISADGLTLYFTGDPGYVWRAQRPTKTSPFGTATLVPELNVGSVQRAAWLSPDMCRLYVAQIRADGGVGPLELYVFSRQP